MIPAHVFDAFTDPVFMATVVPDGRNLGNLSLSSHAFMCPSISLHPSGLTSLLPCNISRSLTISFAVVEPRPNFSPRFWSIRVFGLNTLALINQKRGEK